MRTIALNRLLAVCLIAMASGFSSCKTQKPVAKTPSVEADQDEVTDKKAQPDEISVYRGSRTLDFDLIHTSLDVRFDWEKQQMKGKAELTLRPYFYPTDQMTLDAKGFELRSVGIKKNGRIIPLKYHYDNERISLKLDRQYARTDTVTIWIDYTARPEDIKQKGSSAITDAKGLYFINPLGKIKNKPKQIWTQGETESSSCWFPTIDTPNEKMTQDITMTVDSRYVTLSNGTMISSKPNGDGTRTDHWRQTQPHSPYLAMMAVGEFAVIKDKWNGKDVDYYVEPAFAPYAKDIFGHTPDMIQFFSDVLHYPYAWDKYDQIVVRDYVSGAMENTTATVHGEFLQRTAREMLDDDNEDVISHELFHHWFGDLVTCESWSNIPLNESFATYGEYLWDEHRYGRDKADDHGQDQLHQYMMEVNQTGYKNLIRFHYSDKEDMFDSHSYAKGGRVLHMLRKAIGDSAFFKGLNLYLRQHEFSTVEIHDIRLAMEQVTGTDLNWFFNEWFLNKGHPELEITHSYSEETKECSVTIKQKQDLNKVPLYRIPMDVDVYFGGAVNRYRIDLTKAEQTFTFRVLGKPSLVNVDAEKMLLGTKDETLSRDEYIFMLQNAPLFLDRYEALDGLKNATDPETQAVVMSALEDPYWGIRRKALSILKQQSIADSSALKNHLIWMTQKDEKSAVRASALTMLTSEFSGDPSVRSIIENAYTDQSYLVEGAAMKAIAGFDQEKAFALAKKAGSDASGSALSAIASLYADNGGPDELGFFLSAYEKISNANTKYMFVQLFGKYLLKQPVSVQSQGTDLLENVALNADVWWMRLSAIQVISALRNSVTDEAASEGDALAARLDAVIAKVKATETNATIKGMLGE